MNSAPDYWGRLIIATEAQVTPESFSRFDFLMTAHATRIGNLVFRLSPNDPETV